MPITIPLTRSGSETSSASPGVTLSPVFGSGTGVSIFGGANRQVQVLRAVAAAAAMKKPAEAVDAAKAAVDDPASAFRVVLDQAALTAIFAAVVPLLTDRTGAPTVNEDVRAAAEAIGADPVLATAAFDAMTEGSALVGVQWAATVDATLLDRAARAGERRHQLALVPGAAQGKQIDQLAARVNELDERLTDSVDESNKRFGTVEGRVQALEQRLPSKAGPAAGIPKPDSA